MGQGMRLEDFRALYALRAEDAARRLGISPRSFRRRCRTLGIRRWPHRAVMSKRARAKKELTTPLTPPGWAGSEEGGSGALTGPASRSREGCKKSDGPVTGPHPARPDPSSRPLAGRELRRGPPLVPYEVDVKEAIPALLSQIEVLRMQRLVFGMSAHFSAWQAAQALCNMALKELPPAPTPFAPAGQLIVPLVRTGPLTGSAIAPRGQCVGDAEKREGSGSEEELESSGSA